MIDRCNALNVYDVSFPQKAKLGMKIWLGGLGMLVSSTLRTSSESKIKEYEEARRDRWRDGANVTACMPSWACSGHLASFNLFFQFDKFLPALSACLPYVACLITDSKWIMKGCCCRATRHKESCIAGITTTQTHYIKYESAGMTPCCAACTPIHP